MSLTAQSPWLVDCLLAAVSGTRAELAATVPEFSTAAHYVLAVLLLVVAAARAAGRAVSLPHPTPAPR